MWRIHRAWTHAQAATVVFLQLFITTKGESMLHAIRRHHVVIGGCLALAASCTDPSLLAVDAEAVAPSVSAQSETLVERFTSAIAVSLGDSARRQALFEDLRSSPFPGNRIHLASYMSGARGQALTAAAAANAGLGRARFLALLDSLPPMEIHVQRPYDRMVWSGSSNVVVVGMTTRFRDMVRHHPNPPVTVFTLDGERRSTRLDDFVPETIIYLKPAEVDFGSAPEQTRLSASPRTTMGAELAPDATTSDEDPVCDPDLVFEPCDDNGDPGGMNFGGLWLSHSVGECFDVAGFQDADNDDMRDACELELAQSFAPYLQFDAGESTSGRYPYWSVADGSTVDGVRHVKIFYLLSYYRDGGDPVYGTSGHDGESEFLWIILYDLTGTGRWVLKYASFSAHWRSAWDRSQILVGHNDVSYVGTYRGAIRSHVARNKHANYRTEAQCNAIGGDWCDGVADTPHGFSASRNIGTFWGTVMALRFYTSPCASSPLGNGFTECFWTDDTFRGWQTEHGSGSTGYVEALSAWGF